MKYRPNLKASFPVTLTILVALSGCASAPPPQAAATSSGSPAQTCAALADGAMRWDIPGMRIVSAEPVAAGTIVEGAFGMKSPPLPAHCDVRGVLQERTGQDGQSYAIQFHIRLPDQWNQRFLFQGGSGTNGELGDALGMVSFGAAPALIQGYAVVSQDSGHSNQSNADPARGGTAAFGLDAEARRNYGHASLKASYDAARAIIAHYYHGDPVHSYFAGCSKGGQEGMAFAQRYPDAFDGIVAAAPGISLPKAAIAEAWDSQTYGALVRPAGAATVSVERLRDAFSDTDSGLIRDSILKACDADDGLKDGIVGAFRQCTNEKVMPQLRARQCKGAKEASCLSGAQIDALVRANSGPHDSKGQPLYTNFPWDAGMADPGWRIWKVGLPAMGGRPAIPAINAALGASALATIFSTPPRVMGPTPQDGFDFQMSYDFDRDAQKIFATAEGFPRSGWEDISARSSDLSRFRAKGGKMIVPHGVSDPVFSVNDTIAWWQEVDQRSDGKAASFVRVFPVPGMAHCQGGPATDQFNAFAALVDWVEKGTAPDRIEARGNPLSPWPGRSRPLCPYPLIARPVDGATDTEKASSFTCAL